MHLIRTLVEILFSCALFVNAVLYVPQAIKLYRTKRSGGLSLFMFAGFSVIQLLTILHAFFERDWILLVGYVLAFITCGAITLQLILYHKEKHMQHDMLKRTNKPYHKMKRFVFATLSVLLIVLCILAGNYLNSEHPESKPSELQTEELPIPDKLKEQGEPEITQLNADPQIKEEW